MTNQADSKINITIKEVELVEVGKEKHDETLAKIEAKADKAEVDSLKNTVSENQTQLQEQLQSQSEIINTKLDEVSVKALIAEAELDDLTLEQVQQEVIKQVADKASTQAMIEANQAQDAKIGEVEQSLASKANASALDELKEQLATLVGSDIKNIADAAKDKVDTDTFNQKVDEITQSIEDKADRDHTHQMSDVEGLSGALDGKADSTHTHSLDDITGLNDKLSTLASSENLNALQEQVQSQSELISGKLDEEAVKALIAEAELDDLTLERVQQEIITRVADKASSQAVTEANAVQDDKINQALLGIQELKKEPEIIYTNPSDEVLYVKDYATELNSDSYLKIGNYYIPFFVKKLFKVKQDAFDLELVKGEKYSISMDKFVDKEGRNFQQILQSNNAQVTSDGLSIAIEVSDSTTATLTHDYLDKSIVLNITAIDEINMQQVVDSLEFTTSYGYKVLNLNRVLPETVEVDAIKYVFDKQVSGGRNINYQTFSNPEGESNTLIMEGQNTITTDRGNFIYFPHSVNDASLIRVEIIKDGQSYIKTFEPQEVKPPVGFAV